MDQDQPEQKQAWEPQQSSSFKNRSGLALFIACIIFLAAINVVVSFVKGL